MEKGSTATHLILTLEAQSGQNRVAPESIGHVVRSPLNILTLVEQNHVYSRSTGSPRKLNISPVINICRNKAL